MKKVLVTGGAGFIGSNLCEYFLKSGHKVICLDNFSTGHHYNLKDFINKHLFDRNFYYHQATKIVTVDDKSVEQIADEIKALLA